MSEEGSSAVVVQRVADVPSGVTAEGLAEHLSVAQHSVLAALHVGETISSAAESAGVNRGTIYRWINSDPVFRAAYNAWKRELNESTRARLLKVAEEAVVAVSKAVRGGDSKLAFNVLKEMKMLEPIATGSEDPHHARREMELELREQARVLDEREVRHLLKKTGAGPKRRGMLLDQLVGLIREGESRGAPESPRDESATVECETGLHGKNAI